jgi:hypothetical protein
VLPGVESVTCSHPSFAIVVNLPNDEETETFTLHCYACREALPFFFYTSYEWEGHKRIWNAQRRLEL